jgi:hypothetical protein
MPLYDAAMITANLQGTPTAARTARTAAAVLLLDGINSQPPG